MPDEVTLDVTTIEENVTVETTAGDVVEIQVVAPNGTAATVTVGATTTGAAGTNASVTNSGTTSAAVFNFTIPQGAAGANGGSSTAWNYRAKTNATSGYPTNGHLLWNNATQLSATQILVSHLNDEDSDIELFLSFFVEGQKLFIQNRDDSSQNQIWEITGTPTVTGANTSTAYYTFPVTLVSSQGGAFTNNHSILFGTITVATNSVTSATTSDGTADLNLLEVSTGVLVVSDSFTLSKEIVSGLQTKMTFTANPTAVGDGQQIIWQWYNGGSPITTAAISSESTGSTSDKLIFKTSQGASIATSLDLTYTIATFSGSISSLGESYRATSTFTYASGVAATHRTALGLTTLATTTPGTNVANFLEYPTSANLASALTDENGTGGGFVRAEGATLTTPTLVGTPVFNATAYTYGTGAAAAHRAALNIAPLVDPEMIRGLQLKLAADDLQYQGLVAIANNDTVAAWRAPNKPLTTTAEIVFSQATVGSRPIYQTNIQNSLPGVFFDGVNDVMTSNAALMSLLGNNARTVFIVCRPTALASGGAGTTWNRPQIYGNLGQFNGLSVSPSGPNNILTAWDYDTTGVIKSVATAAVAPNTTVLLTQRHEKGVTSISLNQGTPVTASVLRDCTNATTLQLGSTVAGSGFYQGYIFEILMYARVLTSTEIAVVETYLKTKWNV